MKATCLLLAVGALTLLCLGPPASGATAPADRAISTARALDDVRALAQLPGQTGSDGNAARRRYIVEQLSRLGIAHEEQSTDAVVSLLGRVIAARVVNVVARIAGRERGRAVMLSAHYDAVPNSPGASDDAAGVAALLETARVLRGSPGLRRDVILLFTDGEELGLLGADAFVSEHALAKEVDVVLNFEARGSRGASAMYDTSLPNRGLVEIFARAAPRPVASSLIAGLSRALPNDSDFTIYRRSGMKGFAFAFADGLADYHRSTDTVERLDPRSLAHHLSYAVSVTRALATDEASLNGGGGNAVYFDVLGRWLFGYPEWLARALGVLALGLLLGLVRRAVLNGVARAGGLLWGVWGSIACLIAAPLAATLLDALLAGVLPAGVRLERAAVLLLSYLAVGLAACVEIHRRLLRRASAAELELGALATGAAFSCVIANVVPMASYAPVLSTIPALLGWHVQHGRHGSRPERASRVWWAALALVPAVFFCISIGDTFFVLIGAQLPAVSMLAVGWGAALLLPWTAEMWRKRARRIELGLLSSGSAIAAFVCALFWTRAGVPTFTDLHYVFDAGVRRARWWASTGTAHPQVRQLLRAEAPSGDALPTSALELSSREELSGGRRLSLRLRLAPGVRCVNLVQIGGGKILSSRINGHAPHPNVRFSPELDKRLWQLVTGQRIPDAFQFGYCGPSDEPIALEFTTSDSPVLLAMADIRDGLPPGSPALARDLRFDFNGNRTLVERLVHF